MTLPTPRTAAGAWRVGVVVLTWNGRDDTVACVRSLAHSTEVTICVIVVDNGSFDGTEEAVRSCGVALTFIQNGANLGFSRGNNVGIDVAMQWGANAVLVLNNDTTVEPTTICRLASTLRDTPTAGACSPVVRYATDPGRIWFAGAPYVASHSHAGRASIYELGAPLPQEPFRVDRAVGAAMMVRREVVESVGVFADELFFLYEDVDWSLRMRAAGWDVLLDPGATIAHKVAASQEGTPVTPTTAYYGTRNDLELGRRHGGLSRLRALRREVGCAVVHLAGVRRARRGARLASLRATVIGWRDYRRGRFGPAG